MELITAQKKYFAYWFTLRLLSESLGKPTTSLLDAEIDLTLHQIDAALYVFNSLCNKNECSPKRLNKPS